MTLESPDFKDDKELQACEVDHAHHITRGAVGGHVLKVQNALVKLGFKILPEEMERKTYGSSTAKAVLQFKQDWDIINRSYQEKADDIVGKMTIKELDDAMRSNVYFTLPPAPIVAQSNTYWCWAAALESWLTVSPRTQHTQQELMVMFARWEDPANGGLTPIGWGEVSKRFNLRATDFVPGSRLTAEFLHARLRNNGFLLIVFNLAPGGPAHTNVVYGVRVRSSGSFVKAMDPKGSGQIIERPLNFYSDRDFVGVLWAP